MHHRGRYTERPFLLKGRRSNRICRSDSRSRQQPTRPGMTNCVGKMRRAEIRDLMAELKELRLHGMAPAWEELTAERP